MRVVDGAHVSADAEVRGFNRLAFHRLRRTGELVTRLRQGAGHVQDALVEIPDTYYAITPDGAHIAHQVI